MNQSHVDYLFQITTPLPERGSSSIMRGDGAPPDFGNHLAEATATTTNKFSPVPDYRSPGHRLDYAQTAASTIDSPRERLGDGASETSAADDTIDSNVADKAPDAVPPPTLSGQSEIVGTGCETTGCEPISDVSPEAPDSAPDEDADDVASVVVTVVPPIGTFVADISADKGPEVLADSTTLTASAPEYQSGGNESSIVPKSLVPVEGLRLTDALEDPLAASAVTTIEASGAKLEPQKDVIEPRHPSTTASSKAKKTERAAKRAAADGDRPPQKAENTTVDGEQLAEAVVATVGAKDTESAPEQPADQSRSENSSNHANSKSNTPAVAKGATTAVANGLAVQPAAGASKVDSAEDSNGKVTKAIGATKNDALIAATRPNRISVATRRGAKTTAESDEVPRVDPARFVGRVAKAIQTAHERSSTLQLRLSPPELGAVKLALTVKDGVMTAALETETASARRLLLDHLPALRERLAAQNIRIERFDVDVQRENTGGRPDSQASHQQQQQHNQPGDQAPPRRPAGIRQPAIPKVPQSAAGGQATVSNSRINIVA